MGTHLPDPAVAPAPGACSAPRAPPAAALPFLRGGGAMGALMRGTDWTATPLGPAEAWPQSLRTSVSICLDSGFPVLLWWGPELAMLYNDAYRPILGDKHPRSLGQRGRECWPEIWDTIGPMLHGVLEEGRTSYFEDLMLPLRRRGFAEECYFTFTYSPIRDESGDVGGVFCAVTETTQRVYGERQVACLRDLAAASADTRTYAQAAAATVACLARHDRDVPYSALYLGDAAPDGALVRAGAAGLTPDAGAPEHVDARTPGRWPILQVAATRTAAVVEEAAGPGDARGPRRTIVLPVPATGARGRPGVLVAGLNPMRPLDDGYRGFLDLAARQIAAAVANAQAYEEERTRADALAALDRAKTSFFSNVSHEFRTPLTLLLGPVEDALAAGALSGPALETVHRNAQRLLRLVNTLLDFARIEASRAEATFQATDLAATTADLASNFRSAAERAGLRLSVECPPLPEPVLVDRGMWEKIVLNLLSNAVKFTFEGEIAVRLRAVPGAGVELTVRDTGIGIPAEELPRVFERFHRIRAPRARSVEGSGIGLALVKELVRLHHGTIEVASAPGIGTAFTVALPAGPAHLGAGAVAPAEGAGAAAGARRATIAEVERWLPAPGGPPARRAAAPAPGDGAARTARVLVADDNADMRDYLAAILGERWEVEAVADGAAALAAALRAPPDLVLTDVMMPALDGFELLHRLRADPRTRDVPVVVVSARAGEEARLDGAAARADDYVVKPFSSRELVARVETQLALARLRGETTRALRDSEARFREIADVVPVVLWVADAAGRCTFLNRRWTELTGQEAASALGLGRLDAVHPDDAPATRQALLEAAAGGGPFRAEYRLRCRAGGWRWVLDLGEPRRGPAGELLGLVGSVVDITERRAAEDALRQADQRKSEFLAVLSHELRNPLAPIRNSVALLGRAPPGSGAAERAREILARQTDHLARLVDDLLDLTRISRGKIELRRNRVDAREVVRRSCADVAGLLRERGLELRFAEPPAPCWVDADADRLAQMIGNLVSNAAKFTAPGGRVHVAVRPAGPRCAIRVRDTGVGIAPGDLARIFEPFVQAERTVARSEGGMGIGLALVRELALAHGGTIRADSAGPGHGAEFVLELPLVAAQAAPPRPPPRPRAARRLDVLVVEDNEDAGATLAEVLALDGHRVRVVGTGREGIAAALADPPDVLVCDLGLPDLPGHDVVRAVRAGRADRPLLAVALTGRAQPQDRELALAAGFDAHLAKPPALDRLARLLERAAGQEPAAQEGVGRGDASPPGACSP